MYYLKNKVNDEVFFLHTDKHQRVVQVDTIILGMCNQARPKYPKSLHIFAISPVKHRG